MMDENGVIGKDQNPFSCETWIEKRYELTEGRRKLLPALFGKDERGIRLKFAVNDGTYLAFIAIRWGYAKMVDGIFTATEKWMMEHGE